MPLIAASGPATLIPIVFALACPLMMILMMRGHGHGGHADRTDETSRGPIMLEELKRRRGELNEEIAERDGQALDGGYKGAER